ncbi:MAG: ethylbenzene dehydrogenase-related protein [Candidatus Methylomirabilia bacterium]
MRHNGCSGRGRWFVSATVLLATVSCSRIDVDAVYAVRLAAPPTDAVWDLAMPRLVKAGGGSVHGRLPVLAGLELDTDAVHGASASCHHGPPVTHPTPVQLRAYHTLENLYLDVRWEDTTEDRLPRSWKRTTDGWEIAPDDEDGVAIIWSRGSGRFGCQEACHQSDFTVRGGSLVDVRSMFLAEEGAREEAWVWKPSLGGRQLRIDRAGFTTPGGEPYSTLNSRAAHDPALGPEARRAGMFGKQDAPLTDDAGNLVTAVTHSAPASRWAPAGVENRVAARAERWRRGWRVVFTRPLAAGEGAMSFRPGGRYRFGVAIFDGTSVNHHVVRDSQIFEVVAPVALKVELEGTE